MKIIRFKILVFSLLFILHPLPAWSAVKVMPRAFSDYEAFDMSLEDSDNFELAQPVVWAFINYPAIRRDFKETRLLSDKQIELLLTRNFNNVSEAQLKLNGIRNSPIPESSKPGPITKRQSGDSRADRVDFKDENGHSMGLIGRKGSGVNEAGAQRNLSELKILGPEEIQTLDHSDGLMSLGEALTETLRQLARQALYIRAGRVAETVETYAAGMYPFSIKKGGGQLIPAGFYLRQAEIGRLHLTFESPIPLSESGVDQQDFFGSGIDQGLAKIMDPALIKDFGQLGYSNSQSSADWVFAHETAAAFATSRDPKIVTNYLNQMLSGLGGIDHVLSLSAGQRDTNFHQELESYIKKTSASVNPKEKQDLALVFRYLTTAKKISILPYLTKIRNMFKDPNRKIAESLIPTLEFLTEADRDTFVRKFEFEKLGPYGVLDFSRVVKNFSPRLRIFAISKLVGATNFIKYYGRAIATQIINANDLTLDEKHKILESFVTHKDLTPDALQKIDDFEVSRSRAMSCRNLF